MSSQTVLKRNTSGQRVHCAGRPGPGWADSDASLPRGRPPAQRSVTRGALRAAVRCDIRVSAAYEITCDHIGHVQRNVTESVPGRFFIARPASHCPDRYMKSLVTQNCNIYVHMSVLTLCEIQGL